MRLTNGGYRIDYPYDISTPVADLTTIKIHLNSVISTPKAKLFCTIIRNFYLNNNLPSPEYTRLPIAIIPQEIISEYNLLPLVNNGFVYILIQKGLYGLPHAGKLANDELIKHLVHFGYQPTTNTPGLWTHQTRNISFVLTVDDFGRDYPKSTVQLSMPEYIATVLQKYNHPSPATPEFSPHICPPTTYGATHIKPISESIAPAVSELKKKRIQKIISSLILRKGS